MRALESTFSCGDSVGDSALGNHSGDFKDFRGTADLKSSSPLKSLKNTASTTAIPRILEEENQASLSLRADNGGEAIHNQKVDSSVKVDCHADKSARNDRKNAEAENVFDSN